MEWSEEESLNLINTYKQYPVLWNPKHPLHYNKNKKIDAWAEIASEMGRTDEICRKKIVSLLASFRREKSRERKTLGTGKGTEEVYQSRWFAYEHFKFLEERDEPRPRIHTPVNTDEESFSSLENTAQENLQAETPIVNLISTAESAESFVCPRPPKKRKAPPQQDNTVLLTEALNILQTTAGKISSSSAIDREDNEVKAFCTFLSSKMSSYSPTTRQGVQHGIYEILMRADRGFFEDTHYYQAHSSREPQYDDPFEHGYNRPRNFHFDASHRGPAHISPNLTTLSPVENVSRQDLSISINSPASITSPSSSVHSDNDYNDYV